MIYISSYVQVEYSLCATGLKRYWDGFGYTASRSKTPLVSPQMPPTSGLCLGLQQGIWSHYFLAHASGRAWVRGSAWRACQGGRAPVRSSRLKKVV